MFQDSNMKMKLEAAPLTSVQSFGPELGASVAPLAADGPDKSFVLRCAPGFGSITLSI